MTATWVAWLLIAAAPVSAAAQPPGKFRDERDADAMRTAAFRILLGYAPRVMNLPRSIPFCLAYDISRDPPPEMLERLSDPRYVLKPLSECLRNDLLFKPAGVISGDYNRMALGPLTWKSKDQVEIDSDAFGDRCIVGLTRARKGWSDKPFILGCNS